MLVPTLASSIISAYSQFSGDAVTHLFHSPCFTGEHSFVLNKQFHFHLINNFTRLEFQYCPIRKKVEAESTEQEDGWEEDCQDISHTYAFFQAAVAREVQHILYIPSYLSHFSL